MVTLTGVSSPQSEGAVLVAMMGIDPCKTRGPRRNSLKFVLTPFVSVCCSLALGDRVLIDFNIAQMQQAFPDVLS